MHHLHITSELLKLLFPVPAVLLQHGEMPRIVEPDQTAAPSTPVVTAPPQALPAQTDKDLD